MRLSNMQTAGAYFSLARLSCATMYHQHAMVNDPIRDEQEPRRAVVDVVQAVSNVVWVPSYVRKANGENI